MGNVFAASTPPANIPPPPIGAPPPPTEPPVSATSASQVNKPEDTSNPGTFEDLHKKCKELFPQVFEGGKLIVSKGLSSHFQISHTLSLSTFQPSGYRFGATYVGIKQFSPTEAFPVIIGDVDPSGNLNANVIHAFTDSIRGKLVAQIQNNKCIATQITADYKGKDFTSSLTLGNIDIVNESGIAVTQYLQKVTPHLDLGTELLYQYGQQIPGAQVTVLSLAGRYSGENWQLTGNVSPLAGSVHSCYVHKITDQLHIGAELETSFRLQESVATVGYQIEIPNANATFRGQLDTNWCIGAVLEKKLPPFPFTLALSGYANHVKGQYRFGIGLIVG